MHKSTVCTCVLLALSLGGNAVRGEDTNAKKESPLEGAVYIKSQEAVSEVPVEEIEYHLAWAKTPLRADGDLAKWRKLGVKPVRLAGGKHVSWLSGAYHGDADLSADVYLARDFDNLYIGVQVADDEPPAPNRIEVAFTRADCRPIHGWRDVGERYLADDVHFAFVDDGKGGVGVHVVRSQSRMEWGTLQAACGSETERRAILEQDGPVSAADSKLFTCRKGAFTEIAIPWKTLLPIDPVRGDAFRMNISVSDRDGDGAGAAANYGVVAWTPGLAGTYSGGHFARVVCDPPAGATATTAYAQVPTHTFLRKEAAFDVSVHAGAAFRGDLELVNAADGKAFASKPLELGAGATTNFVLAVDPEMMPEGKNAFAVRLGGVGTFPVHVPAVGNRAQVYHLAGVQARIDALRNDLSAYSNLYAKVVAAGCDTVYPKAWLTMLQMFIPQCESDLKRGDPARVLRNTDYLKGIYEKATAYAKRILADPSAQMFVPQDDPSAIKIRDGFYRVGDRPVFLWGPCTFWYLRDQTPYVVGLGFNSVCTELGGAEFAPDDFTSRRAKEAYSVMKAYHDAGIRLNVNPGVPDLQLTGADARRSKFLAANPDVKNMDPNNFLPFVVQHPAVREAIRNGYAKSIPGWSRYSLFDGIHSLWLWNEPWYLNYSERTRRDFINEYLKPLYGNDIAKLNKRWKSNYAGFDDIKLIQWPDPANYAPWNDFQTFRDNLLADFFKSLHDEARKYRPDLPTHVKFMSTSLSSFDLEKMQEPFEIVGRDGNNSDRDTLYLDFFRSVYPKRPIADTEVHIWYLNEAVVSSVAWRMALHGLSDGNWWCWHSNPRFSDSISNARSMDALVFSGLDIRRLYADYVHPLVIKRAPIATLFPDVCERRTDLKLVRMRFEIAPPQYMLGLRPSYVSERMAARGDLRWQKILFAAESMWVKDATYARVLEFVKNGGTLIALKNGFRTNEDGDPRDTRELIQEGGEPYGEYAHVYRVGRGRVIRIDALELLDDPVADGGVVLRGGPAPDNTARRRIYDRVLNEVMVREKLVEDVRIVAADDEKDNPDALRGYDWRAVKLKDGSWSLVVLTPAEDLHAKIRVKLETTLPVEEIVDLRANEKLPGDKLNLKPGPNAYRIRLQGQKK